MYFYTESVRYREWNEPNVSTGEGALFSFVGHTKRILSIFKWAAHLENYQIYEI